MQNTCYMYYPIKFALNYNTSSDFQPAHILGRRHALTPSTSVFIVVFISILSQFWQLQPFLTLQHQHLHPMASQNHHHALVSIKYSGYKRYKW